MTRTEIRSRIRAFIQENFLYMRSDFQLGDEDSLLGTGIIDSMGVMELTAFLQDEFGFHVEDEEITQANLGSVAALIRFTEGKRSLDEAVA